MVRGLGQWRSGVDLAPADAGIVGPPATSIGTMALRFVVAASQIKKRQHSVQLVLEGSAAIDMRAKLSASFKQPVAIIWPLRKAVTYGASGDLQHRLFRQIDARRTWTRGRSTPVLLIARLSDFRN